MLDLRFKRTTLFIISNRALEIYEYIKDTTHHGATLFHGIGLYNEEARDMIYSVVSSDEVKSITRAVREIDPHAFVNAMKTEHIAGNFYLKPRD